MSSGRQGDLLESLTEAALDGILAVSSEGRMLTFNRRFAEMWGIPRRILASRSDGAALRFVLGKLEHPEEFLERVRHLYAHPRETSREEILLKDGRVFDRYSGPILDRRSAEPLGRVWFFRDVSGQKRAEQRREELEEQVRQSQKMEAMGRLAGGMAHDFNTLLTGIQGYGEMILARVRDDATLSSFTDEVLRAGRRASELTRQLLAFSRKQVLDVRVNDLNALVEEMGTLLRRVIGDDIELSVRLEAARSAVKVDATQLHQVIVNLALNARDAMPAGGRLEIRTRDCRLDGRVAGKLPHLKPGRYVAITVRDTGTGLSPEAMAHLFEPFFTTKPPGKGTGLGLSTVYGIVKQSGGHILVQSKPGRGATFTIYLPAVEEAVPPKPRREPPAPRKPGHGERILVVDDSGLIRRLVREALQPAGYVVREAQGGREAIRIVAEEGGRFQLLLTDIVMPEMNGRELAERLLPRYPGLRVLYMSGYADGALERHGFSSGSAPFLPKPFSLEELRGKVQEVLGATPAGTPRDGKR